MGLKILLITGIVVEWTCCHKGDTINYRSVGKITGADPGCCRSRFVGGFLTGKGKN